MITPGFRPVASWLALVYSKPNLSLKLLIREAKMEAEDIERYLAELGAELKNRGLKKRVRVLLIGGAYNLRTPSRLKRGYKRLEPVCNEQGDGLYSNRTATVIRGSSDPLRSTSLRKDGKICFVLCPIR
jgi:hypothetical protein